jgi:hypothetical protein
MRQLSLWAAVLVVVTTVACYHAPIATAAAPSADKKSADENAPGLYVFGIRVESMATEPVHADVPGLYIGNVRVDAP